MPCFSIISYPKSRKFLEKNQNGFWRNCSTTRETLLLVDFFYAFNTIHWKNGINTTCIWNSYNNSLQKPLKAMVYSSDSHQFLWCRCWSFAKRYISTIFIYTLPRDYILWTSIDLIVDNGFRLKRARSRCYPADTITLFAYTPAQVESFLHSLE